MSCPQVVPARPTQSISHDLPNIPATHSTQYEDRFDTSTTSRLFPTLRSTKLYETVAHAHDHRSFATPAMAGPLGIASRPLTYTPRRVSFSKAMKSPPSSASPYISDRHLRRSSYETRRGSVGVMPSEVNTLVPYIPPIDTSVPPPSKEWLDAQAQRILAQAIADIERRNQIANPAKDNDFDWNFDYDSDSTVEEAITRPSAPRLPPPPPRPEPEVVYQESEDNWTDTDTDSGMDSDDGYNWSMTRISESSPHALTDVPKWIIPRKRPSVDILPTLSDSVMDVDGATTHTQQARRPSKGGKWADGRRGDDPHTRMGRKKSIIIISDSEDESSSTVSARTSSIGSDMARSSCPSTSATTPPALEPQDGSSPAVGILEPQPVPPRTPKTFCCTLNGCSHICGSAGDLQRHQQSLRHRAPSYGCLACGKSYTRSDALKRHLNSKASCKRDHTARLAQQPDGERQTEANA